MNTKQLWNALILNLIINKYSDGIFSIDTLQDIKEKPTLIICYTDPSCNFRLYVYTTHNHIYIKPIYNK